MESRDEIYEKLVGILVEMFELHAADITVDAHLYEDLDLDSIDAVDLVLKLKEWTSQKISPEDFKTVVTVNDVLDAIEVLLNQRA